MSRQGQMLMGVGSLEWHDQICALEQAPCSQRGWRSGERGWEAGWSMPRGMDCVQVKWEDLGSSQRGRGGGRLVMRMVCLGRGAGQAHRSRFSPQGGRGNVV